MRGLVLPLLEALDAGPSAAGAAGQDALAARGFGAPGRWCARPTPTASSTWTAGCGAIATRASCRTALAEEAELAPDRQPILLTAGVDNPNHAEALFLLDGAEPGPLDAYSRCILLFGGRPEQAAAALARRRWTVFKAGGHPVSYWRQGAERAGSSRPGGREEAPGTDAPGALAGSRGDHARRGAVDHVDHMPVSRLTRSASDRCGPTDSRRGGEVVVEVGGDEPLSGPNQARGRISP